MSSRAIRNDADKVQAQRWLDSRRYPYTLSVVEGSPRSTEQNKLQRKWLLEAEEQGDMTAEEYRAYCKLHFGVPIMRRDSEDFKEKYDRILKPHSYEDKLTMMMVPLDFPVTRAMTTKQKTEYLDAMYNHFRGLGFQLTEPEGK